MRQVAFNRTEHDYIELAGGWDLNTPVLKVPPGRVRDALNYECDVNGGYTGVEGYERFDGRAKPSAASYTVLPCEITGSYALGNTVTGLTSAATGVLIAVVSVAGTADQFIVTKVVGTFTSSEALQIGGTTRATMNGAPIQNGASTTLLDAQYKNLAADNYRADILAVPGSGPVRGVLRFNGVTYAFRNDAAGTALDVYKNSATGWTLVALGRERSFTSGGTYVVVVGNTITGATSGATAVITAVMLESGSWAAGTAAGKFIFASQTGVFVAENLNVGANLDVATIAGNGAAITMLPSGKFEFDIANFGGQSGTLRVYGVDGVNRGFEFDGTVFAPITTGMTVDQPKHVWVHKNHLFYAFGSSAQHSGIGTPFMWTLLAGAGELAVGDTITGFDAQPGSADGGALAIFSRNKIAVLYGSSSANWNLVTYARDVGAIEWSIQHVGTTIMLDDRGLTNLSTATQYGNFQHATLSTQIQSWLNAQRLKVNASCIVRDKSQHRLFFSDKYALYATFNGAKIVGMMPVFYAHTLNVVHSVEESDGTETIFAGSADDGFVYQLDMGTSFDGDAIDSYLQLTFNHLKTPRFLHRYKRATFIVRGTGYSSFNVSAEIGYGTTEIEQLPEAIVTSFSSVFWDQVDWDNFVWDGVTLLPSHCELSGTAENISLKIAHSSDYFYPLTFNAILLDYTTRRRLR